MNGSFNLPSWLTEIEFPNGGDLRVRLVVATERGQFDTILEAQTGLSENAELILKYLRGQGTLIDVGANIGSIALPVAKTGTNVVAIEMLPANIAKLGFATLANGLSNVRIVQAAASNFDTIISYSGDEAWGSVGATGAPAVGYKLDTLVRMTDLAEPNFMKEPMFLKIDVEGHEAAVIEGSTYFLSHFRPFVLFEAIDYPDNGEEALSAKVKIMNAGYRLYSVSSGVLTPYEHNQLQVQMVSDFLAVPTERVSDIASLFPGHSVRELTDREMADALLEMCNHTSHHRNHVLRVLGQQQAPVYGEEVLRKLENSPEFEIASAAKAMLALN